VPVTEVERFFRRLVSTLASSDPVRLQEPLPLDDVTGSILPYRTHRRALQLETVEDYESVLLRLCAGEDDLVWIEPEEARKRFMAESRSANPDLTALYAFEDVRLSFRPEPLLWALAPDPQADLPPDGQEPVIELGSAQVEVRPLEDEPETVAAPAPEPTCLFCGGSLPANRQVNFCPHCGESQTRILCPECRSEVEPGWRHCVNCGAAVSGARG
jgi:predicted RNA-binding Zn-ribbon protein involved in translation (DUF1610 family)